MEISLGALALGASEVPHATCFDHAQEDAGLVQGAHRGAFVATGGFADDL